MNHEVLSKLWVKKPNILNRHRFCTFSASAANGQSCGVSPPFEQRGLIGTKDILFGQIWR